MGSRKTPKSIAMITGFIRRGQIALALSLITLLLLSAVPYSVNAADGNLDLSFGVLGKVTTDFYGGQDRGEAVVLQSDGKIVVAGYRVQSGTDYDFALARYNTDGTLDTSFGGDGKVTTDFFGGVDMCEAVALQNDGKIIAVGYCSGIAGNFAIARYNTDGALDTSFSGDGKVSTDFFLGLEGSEAVVLQNDGKIVVAGVAYGGVGFDFALARYNSDGSLDDGTAADSTPADSFGSLGKVTTDFSAYEDWAYAVTLQSDGKIVVAGSSRQISTYNDDFALARYNTDGTLDTSFSGDGKVITDFFGDTDRSEAVVLQSDGKIIAVGYCLGSADYDFALVRYNSDGSLDDGTAADATPADSFGSLGKVTTDFSAYSDYAIAVALQSDGKIMVVGYSGRSATYTDFVLVRYNVDGTLDTSFSGDGKVITDFYGGPDRGAGVVVQSDGKIVVAGSAYAGGVDLDFALARYEGDSSAQSNINDVITGINGSNLPAGTETSLNAKLQAALAALRAGDTAAACSSLQDFLNYVRAQRGKNISAQEADALTDNVTQIRAELGCP